MRKWINEQSVQVFRCNFAQSYLLLNFPKMKIEIINVFGIKITNLKIIIKQYKSAVKPKFALIRSLHFSSFTFALDKKVHKRRINVIRYLLTLTTVKMSRSVRHFQSGDSISNNFNFEKMSAKRRTEMFAINSKLKILVASLCLTIEAFDKIGGIRGRFYRGDHPLATFE